MDKEPQIIVEIVDDTKTKKEIGWTPEKILSILKNAIEDKNEVELTVLSLEGNVPRTKIIIPDAIEDNVLQLTTKNGYKIAIELSRITRAFKIAINLIGLK